MKNIQRTIETEIFNDLTINIGKAKINNKTIYIHATGVKWVKLFLVDAWGLKIDKKSFIYKYKGEWYNGKIKT